MLIVVPHGVGCQFKTLDECYAIMMVEDITFSFIEVDVNNVTLPNKNVERC